ncbi:hypothetical protein [Escherichia coli]|uniref:hypothetical protein n=1 Tax=Escherichia coli TaxID=562 RepID=UPI000E218286|nr:hypothetical protein [Escherichia coli]EEC8741779.1 hypothetical protein [Escherichia coli]EER6636682.1 hypothetical protein [Escherichia coli]EEY6724530.1 hypothetical protein [Escherichia coli]EEY9014801.1 hypothetical protein [Escherichia coli]EFE1453601.1 hypothetical protein [Escherichia coli]
MKDIINVSSLDDIESLFARLDGGEEITIDRIKLDLFNNVNFKIYGDPSRYNGTLPSSLAQGLCEVEVKQEETKLEEAKIKSENERMTILRDGMLESIRAKAGIDAVERAEGIQEHTAKAYTGVLKGASDADKIVISGASTVELSNKEIHELIKNPIEKAKKEERNLELVIDGIKRTAEKITLSCREPSSEDSFPVSVDTSFIDDKDEIAILFDAMKENRTVKILGSYTIRAGVIENGNASTITRP